MKKYTAFYQCSKCQAQQSKTVNAVDILDAIKKLPRWIYPDGHKMRRAGGIEYKGS